MYGNYFEGFSENYKQTKLRKNDIVNNRAMVFDKISILPDGLTSLQISLPPYSIALLVHDVVDTYNSHSNLFRCFLEWRKRRGQ